jgi:dienelactone hydrolase
MVGLTVLESLGKARIVLVGHFFGCALVIDVGAIGDAVITMAALGSQTAGTAAVKRLSPKSVLSIHGSDDEILPDACSRDLHARVGEPKEVILYPGCRHGLYQCREALDRDLMRCLTTVLLPARHDYQNNRPKLSRQS